MLSWVALTTIATTLKTMLAKGLVQRGDGPRGYVWSAAASRGSTATGLVGKPIIRLIRGFSVQIVGFGIPNPGGRPTLSREFSIDEGATTTLTLIGKVIRR